MNSGAASVGYSPREPRESDQRFSLRDAKTTWFQPLHEWGWLCARFGDPLGLDQVASSRRARAVGGLMPVAQYLEATR